MPPGGIGNNTTRKPEAVLSRRVVRHSVVSLVSRLWKSSSALPLRARGRPRARRGNRSLATNRWVRETT
jgi:hypothetical protein